MNGVGSSFLLNSTFLFFFGNIYKIAIDFNFLEKKKIAFFFFLFFFFFSYDTLLFYGPLL